MEALPVPPAGELWPGCIDVFFILERIKPEALEVFRRSAAAISGGRISALVFWPERLQYSGAGPLPPCWMTLFTGKKLYPGTDPAHPPGAICSFT